MSAMCNEARASAEERGASWSRNFVNPKYFFLYFVISSFVYEPKRCFFAWLAWGSK